MHAPIRPTQAKPSPRRPGWAAWYRSTRPANALSAPIIYGMIFPLLLLDLSISFYQATCFPLYGLPKVDRKKYIVLDRRRLLVLNVFDRISCEFCSYANGVLSYALEIISITEQFWCPIRHSRAISGAHKRYGGFIEYGAAHEFYGRLDSFRKDLREEKRRDRMDESAGSP
jgi:hypothetical protein